MRPRGMTRSSLLLLVLVAAGCGSSSSSSGRAATAAPISSVTTGTTTTPLVAVHGELVAAPALAGGTALAFLPDGAAEAREVTDPSALVAAGLHEGFTLVLDGDALPNTGGRTALAGAVRVSAFQADDVVTGGTLTTTRGGGVVAFTDPARTLWVPVGPLAASLLGGAPGAPVLVTGRDAGAGTVTVTSWRPAVQLHWESQMPLLGSSSLVIEDLEGTGAYRTETGMVQSAGYQVTKGEGRRLDASVLGDLRARLTAANLRALPPIFQPPQLYPGNPSQTVRLVDAQGEVAVTVMGGSNPPPELAGLLQALGALPAALPQVRTVAQGDTSAIATAGAEAARDQAAWNDLWTRHVAPARPLVPSVDFTREVAVGVFDGQRPSGGYAIEVTTVVRIGPHLHLPVRRTSPGGIATTVLTAPFHVVAVDLAGRQAHLFVEGRRLP